MARVLVAEDDQSVLMMLNMLLEKDGHEVVLTADGKAALEALEAANETMFDLVVTDIFMPGMDGFELIGSIRKASPEMKIIVVSGRDGVSELGPNFLNFAKTLGADRVIAKPIDSTEFSLTVEQCLAA